MLNASGLFEVRQIGHSRPLPMKYIHLLLRVRWRYFFPMVIIHFLVANLTFAGLYWWSGAAVSGADSFLDCFFFSVQTVLTIGYGGMLPANLLADILATVEAFIGLVAISMMTGLVFVRVLNPSTAITFSRCATISSDGQGRRVLSFRVADQGQQDIAQAEMQVMIIHKHNDAFEMQDLPLERASHAALVLTWTACHVIDAESPLHGATPESFARSEILVTFIGLDSRSGQTVVARHSYVASDLMWEHELPNVVSFDDEGHATVDFRRFHEAGSSPG